MHWQPGAVELATAAAGVAGLIYLAREIRKLAKVITFWSGLPKAHEHLQRATDRNTAAIQGLDDTVAELAVQVAHLTQVERARGDG